MASEIELKIDGENVRPETVPLADLLDVLRKFHRAIVSTALDGGVPKDEVRVSLTAIAPGSNLLGIHTDDRTHKHAGRLIEAIDKSSPAGIPRAAELALRDLWKKAKAKQWEIGIQRSNGKTFSTATIRPEIPLFQEPTARGYTSFVVRIDRIGGEGKATAIVYLPNRQKLTATVASREVAERLGRLLFKHVEVHCDAIWNTSDGLVRALTIKEVGTYVEEASDPVAALNQLAEASNGFWDTVDPDEYISEQRAAD